MSNIKNCVLCGSLLLSTNEGEKFCPNHGLIIENQEWKTMGKAKYRQIKWKKDSDDGNDDMGSAEPPEGK